MNSLRNVPNGGEPVIARKPAIHSTPVTGKTLPTPETSPTFFVRYRASMLPAVRNNAALVSE